MPIALIIAGGGALLFFLLRKPKEPVAEQKKGVNLKELGAIGAIAGAIIGVIEHFLSKTHLVANEWVQEVQNPFGLALAEIADNNATMVRNHTATVESVTEAKNALTRIWDAYRAAAAEFARKDQDHAIVIGQSLTQLTPLINQIQRDMDADIARIKTMTY